MNRFHSLFTFLAFVIDTPPARVRVRPFEDLLCSGPGQCSAEHSRKRLISTSEGAFGSCN